MKQMFNGLGEDLSLEEAQEMVNEADLDGNEQIDYEEFSRIMNKK